MNNKIEFENDYKCAYLSNAYLIKKKEKVVLYSELISGGNTITNYIWFILLFLFGLGFCAVGLSSYFKEVINFLPFTNISSIEFIPQGILLLFYGTSSILLSFLILLLIKLNIGSGTNIYDIESKVIRISRQGFPNFTRKFKIKQKNIYLVYPFSQILNLELEIKDGIAPRRVIYLILKDGRRIPLTPSNQLYDLLVIEKRAIFISKLLKIDLNFKDN